MKCALYCRVSTEDQDAADKTSISDQLRRNHATAARQGWEAVEYVDSGRSGTTIEGRPEMVRLLADIQAGEIDAVVVTHVDRLARKGTPFQTIKDTLQDCGVLLVAGEAIYDPSINAQWLTLDINASVASYNRTDVIERLSKGSYASARAGNWPRTPPFGFRLRWSVDAQGRRQPNTKATIEHHPDEAATIKQAVQLVLGGLSTGEAATELNRNGHLPRGRNRAKTDSRGNKVLDERGKKIMEPQPSVWSGPNLLHLLRSPTLFGRLEFGKLGPRGHGGSTPSKQRRTRRDPRSGSPKYAPDGPVVVEVEPIVPGENWHELQAVLDRTAYGSQRKRATAYPLSGRMSSPCGRHYAGQSSPAVRYRSYRCAGNKIQDRSQRCTCKSLNAADIEGRVWHAVISTVSDKDWKEELDKHFGPREDIEARLDGIEDKLTRKRKTRDEKLTELLDAGIPADAIKTQSDRLDGEIRKLESERDELVTRQQSNIGRDRLAERMDEVARRAHELHAASLPEQKRWLDLFDVQVQILDTDRPPREVIVTGRTPSGSSRWFTGVAQELPGLAAADDAILSVSPQDM